MKKVVLGLSGGVDSAVAAHILRVRGYEVTGAYLDLFNDDEKADAVKSASELGIPLEVIPAREELAKLVAEPFRESCLSGRTLNPCVICNPNVKLRLLNECADSLGAEYIATGHYCVCDHGGIYMGDRDFDQSYMFCRTPKELISRLILPLGDMKKQRVREIALKKGVSVHKKPDSRDGCFFDGMSCADWVASKGGAASRGNVIFEGETIGSHEGVYRYTVGQRFSETAGKRLYVKRIEGGDLILSDWNGLFESRITISGLMDFGAPEGDFTAAVRARHTRREMPVCRVTRRGDRAFIEAETPFRAPCPGQAAAVYIDGRLVLSGIIE